MECVVPPPDVHELVHGMFEDCSTRMLGREDDNLTHYFVTTAIEDGTSTEDATTGDRDGIGARGPTSEGTIPTMEALSPLHTNRSHASSGLLKIECQYGRI